MQAKMESVGLLDGDEDDDIDVSFEKSSDNKSSELIAMVRSPYKHFQYDIIYHLNSFFVFQASIMFSPYTHCLT